MICVSLIQYFIMSYPFSTYFFEYAPNVHKEAPVWSIHTFILITKFMFVSTL